MTLTDNAAYIAALDIGERRIGVALAHRVAALPSPYTTLTNDASLWAKLQQIIDKEQIGALVIGLPRGLNGQETAQTAAVRAFVEELQRRIDLPVHWQDEAVTSVQAEDRLKARRKRYNKELVDAYAAAIILQDYLDSLRGTHHG